MGIFNFWTKTKTNGIDNGNGFSVVPETSEIPKNEPSIVDKNIFIEEEEKKKRSTNVTDNHVGISGLMRYLEEMNYEELGYNDAIVCSDPHYKEQRINQFVVEFKVKIDSSIAHCQKLLKEYTHFAQNAQEHGLLQKAGALIKKVESVQSEIDLQQTYLNDLEGKIGVFERISLPYQNGFTRGVLAGDVKRITETN